MNHLGPEGYHWRVCVEDKSVPGNSDTHSIQKSFSWWDIQDENASLPIKEATSQQLHKFFTPPSPSSDSYTDPATKVAKGAFKTLGKAMSQAVSGATDGNDQSGPLLKVVAFKLLDLVKMHDDFATKHRGRSSGGQIPQPGTTGASHQNKSSIERPPVQRQPPQPQQNVRAVAPSLPSQPNRPHQPQQVHHEASLMDFGPSSSSTSSSAGTNVRHSTSMPVASSETRAEKLKREYAQKNMSAQRVWDDIDQRWVEVDAEKNSSAASLPSKNNSGVSSLLGGMGEVEKKVVGISLDPANAVGKSATVQAAVNSRVNEMRESQAKALQEVRDREERKKKEEADEDEVRRRLEPVIKQWSEEHGKKKQLRALLASLHTILWPGAQWKQVGIGDLLDDKKVKLAFHKASRVVHPDKTHHLEAEQRFLAKRIFDALSQAKNEFDGSK